MANKNKSNLTKVNQPASSNWVISGRTQVIKKSKGAKHKQRIVVFLLAFLFASLLSALCCGLALIFVGLFVNVTSLNFNVVDILNGKTDVATNGTNLVKLSNTVFGNSNSQIILSQVKPFLIFFWVGISVSSVALLGIILEIGIVLPRFIYLQRKQKRDSRYISKTKVVSTVGRRVRSVK